MPYHHPYKPNKPDDEPRGQQRRTAYTGMPDLDDALHDVVQTGTGLGAEVLGAVGSALRSVGEALAGNKLTNKNVPFPTWRKRLDRFLKNEKQDGALAVSIVGWVFAGIFGIATAGIVISMGTVLQEMDLPGFAVLAFVFGCITGGFGVMGAIGHRRYAMYKRLRAALHAARDWVCPIAQLTALTGLKPDTLREDLRKGIENESLPGVLLAPDGETLYWDDARYTPPAAAPEPAPEPAAAPDTALAAFLAEGQAFLAYLRGCRGQLGPAADEQLAQMDKTCAAILGFAHNHPGQLPRLRRFREYYLPTTRKLLDTARGLGDTGAESAEKIRGEITGILYTLNSAYQNLYDTLLQDVRLDVSTEIDTLESMLRQDGLTNDFEEDFGSRAKPE